MLLAGTGAVKAPTYPPGSRALVGRSLDAGTRPRQTCESERRCGGEISSKLRGAKKGSNSHEREAGLLRFL